MKTYIIHCQDKEGNLIDITASSEDDYSEIQKAIFEKGFLQVKGKVYKPKIIFDPNRVVPCPNCGTAMIPRAGTSKEGRPYKGYFCPNDKEKGCKPVWAE